MCEMGVGIDVVLRRNEGAGWAAPQPNACSKLKQHATLSAQDPHFYATSSASSVPLQARPSLTHQNEATTHKQACKISLSFPTLFHVTKLFISSDYAKCLLLCPTLCSKFLYTNLASHRSNSPLHSSSILHRRCKLHTMRGTVPATPRHPASPMHQREKIALFIQRRRSTTAYTPLHQAQGSTPTGKITTLP